MNVKNYKGDVTLRPRLYKNYATTTLKLEQHTMTDFMRMLNGKSKNSYIVEKIVWLREFFKNANDEEKVKFMIELVPYSSRRKLTGAAIETDRRKEAVVSVKCEKEDYDIVVKEAGKLGLTFSEIIRRLIIKDIENQLKN